MRGKVLRVLLAFVRDRITPAYAGKSVASAYTLRSSWDHPRLCGEKTIKICLTLWKTGSPPPMRGKAARTLIHNDIIGITPAYAGKSLSGLSVRLLYRDHPRLCGEKMRRSFEKGYDKGSPPPMRGKGPPVADMWKRSGITPAYAGKRPHISSSLSQSRDHPRLCGEK